MLLQGRCQERGRLNTDTKETEYDGSGDCVDTNGEWRQGGETSTMHKFPPRAENGEFGLFFFPLLSGKEKEF